MKTFYEYLNSRQKYISAIYNKETQDNLRVWCQLNGFDLTVDYNGNLQPLENYKFHTTIWYTESFHDNINNQIINLNNDNSFLKNINPFKCNAYEFKLLGENNNIPVLSINSKELCIIRNKFYDEYKMKDKWNDYLPHISLSYRKDGVTKDIFKNLELPKFDLIVDTIEIEDIETL